MTAQWVGPPRSYSIGRNRPIQYIVLHYTAGAEGPNAAENGAAYDKIRTDGVSTHYFTDSSGPALQEVKDGDRAHAALFRGNELGIQIEICGTRQTREQWLDGTSYATLKTTAQLVSELCAIHGIPKVRLTAAQVRAAWYAAAGSRPKGICDHGTVTAAYPEDGGTHTDVGPEFPWDVFFELLGEVVPPGPVLRRPWPSYMPAGHVFGPYYGPVWQHGGYGEADHSNVRAIQQRLIATGSVPGVSDPNSSWADGWYGANTVSAAVRFQQSHGLYADGLVGPSTWPVLFTY